jgi:hypothetical protein
MASQRCGRATKTCWTGLIVGIQEWVGFTREGMPSTSTCYVIFVLCIQPVSVPFLCSIPHSQPPSEEWTKGEAGAHCTTHRLPCTLLQPMPSNACPEGVRAVGLLGCYL